MTHPRTQLALLALLVSVTLPTLAAAATITVGPTGDYSNLYDAVAAASSGDIIEVANGSYAHTATLTLAQPITIRGATEAGVILNVATAGWGINVAASDVTLEKFTIQVVNLANQGYPIHAHGGVPEIANLTITDVTVQGATAGTQRRSGVDLNRVDDVVLDRVTSTGATSGVGIAISGCVGVTMTDVVTAGNAWGGIAIYCTNDPLSEPARGSDNVTIVSATNSEPVPIYREDEFGAFNTDPSLPWPTSTWCATRPSSPTATLSTSTAPTCPTPWPPPWRSPATWPTPTSTSYSSPTTSGSARPAARPCPSRPPSTRAGRAAGST